jgi:hypothetical protein
MSRIPRPLTATLALAIVCLPATFIAACSLTTAASGAGSTTVAIPTFSPAPFQAPPVHTAPGPVTGGAAIKPHLNTIPAFTTQDMADYARGHLPGGGSESGLTIARSVFLPSQDVGALLGTSTSQPEGVLVGLLVAQGAFPLPGGVPDSLQTYPFAFEVFDAKTGNLLMQGGLTGPVPDQAPTPTPGPTATATPAPAPKLSVSADSSAFCLNGQYPTITVVNSGGGTLTWSAKPSYSGMTVTPSSGTLSATEAQVVTVSGSAPPPTESVSFTSNGGNATITFNCK